MGNDDFTIKVSLDFDDKDLSKLEGDVRKAVNNGSRKSESISSTVSRKVSEMQSDASSSIYKYGVNHLKTRAILGDLNKAQKVQSTSFIQSEREKRESFKTDYQQKKQDSSIRMSSMRESDLGDRIDSRKKRLSGQKMSNLFRNVRAISLSSFKSAEGITSMVSKLGPAGLAVGAALAGGLGLGKLVKWGGNKALEYSGAALGGGGYTTGDMAALMSGGVSGINRNIGQNMAQSISENSPFLSKGYLPRQAMVLARATQAVSLYKGGMAGIRNLDSIKSSDSEKSIYSKLFSDFRYYMSKGMPNAAIRLGGSFGLSRQSVLAAKYIPDINKRIKGAGSSGLWKSFDGTAQAALKQTSAIDHLTSQVNKLAAVIVNATTAISSINPKKQMNSMFPNPMTYDPFHIAPGNSAKGIK